MDNFSVCGRHSIHHFGKMDGDVGLSRDRCVDIVYLYKLWKITKTAGRCDLLTPGSLWEVTSPTQRIDNKVLEECFINIFIV